MTGDCAGVGADRCVHFASPQYQPYDPDPDSFYPDGQELAWAGNYCLDMFGDLEPACGWAYGHKTLGAASPVFAGRSTP